MKILLVAPYKQSYCGLAEFPPIGLGYLATSLRKNSHQVEILDCLKEGIGPKEYAQYLKESRPQAVGVNSWSSSIPQTKEILRITKEINEKIITIIGGPHPSALPSEAMECFSLADFAFRGEAETGLSRLMDYLDGGQVALDDVGGLIWRKDGRLVVNQQSFSQDLDSLGFPAWDLIKPKTYGQAGATISKSSAPMITTRGCPYQCTFCAPHIISGRKLRYRSVDDIIEEIKLLNREYQIKKIVIFDENFTFDIKRAKEFCRRIINSKMVLSFLLPNGIRLDRIDSELLDLMRQAGFSPSVAVGIESGSARILKMIKKSLTKDEIREKVKLLRSKGFRPIGYFILGFPTETIAEMKESLAFAKELKLYRAAFAPLLLLPGTEITNQLKANNQLPEGFDFSSISTDSIDYAPEGMSLAEFAKIRREIILSFNLRPRVILDYLRDFNSFMFAFIKFREIFLKPHKKNAVGKCNHN